MCHSVSNSILFCPNYFTWNCSLQRVTGQAGGLWLLDYQYWTLLGLLFQVPQQFTDGVDVGWANQSPMSGLDSSSGVQPTSSPEPMRPGPAFQCPSKVLGPISPAHALGLGSSVAMPSGPALLYCLDKVTGSILLGLEKG